MLTHFKHVLLSEILWTVAFKAPLSMEFSGQDYRSDLPRPPPGDLPDPGIKSTSLVSPALAGEFFTTSTTCEALFYLTNQVNQQRHRWAKEKRYPKSQK